MLFVGIGGVASGKDPQQQDFTAGQALLELLENGKGAVGRLLRRVTTEAGVVGADQQYGELGLGTGDAPILQAPQDVIGVVATGSDLHCTALAVELSPDFFALSLSAEDDGVADH